MYNEWQNKFFNSNSNILKAKYYYGNKWKSTLPNFNAEIKFNSLEKLIEFWDSEIKKIEKEIFNVFNSFTNYGENAKSYLEYFIRNLNNIRDEASLNSYSSSAVSNYNQFLSTLTSWNYSVSKSEFRMLLDNKKAKSIPFLQGFTYFFYTNSHRSSMYGEMIDGFEEATTISNSLSLAEPSKKIKELFEEYAKDHIENEKQISMLQDELQKFKSESEELVKNYNEGFDDVKKSLLIEKNKLMLSGPLKMWYTKLTDYTGHKYTANKDNNFEYEIEKKSWWKVLKGRISFFMFLTIIWAIAGIGVIFGIFFGIEHWMADKINDHVKLTIFISVLGSLAIFIYGYVLRIFVKNWLSAKHIAEEIEERISLTQFYLSLKQEGNIQKEHEAYAIQEIFKKSNTGLIKETGGVAGPMIDIITKGGM